ncbi:MAG: (2Fe-2S)-binding protein [Nitrospinota bacterium]
MNLNGVPHEVVVEPDWVLLDVLREELDYTGAKRGCDGTGECGTCTVIIDGKAIYSCLTLALEAEGKEITTIEGLAQGGELHPIQKAFIEHGAIQCGFCTPGMVLTAKALLDENPRPTEDEVREALRGNLCRCTGYVKIVEAILAASESRRRA